MSVFAVGFVVFALLVLSVIIANHDKLIGINGFKRALFVVAELLLIFIPTFLASLFNFNLLFTDRFEQYFSEIRNIDIVSDEIVFDAVPSDLELLISDIEYNFSTQTDTQSSVVDIDANTLLKSKKNIHLNPDTEHEYKKVIKYSEDLVDEYKDITAYKALADYTYLYSDMLISYHSPWRVKGIIKYTNKSVDAIYNYIEFEGADTSWAYMCMGKEYYSLAKYLKSCEDMISSDSNRRNVINTTRIKCLILSYVYYNIAINSCDDSDSERLSEITNDLASVELDIGVCFDHSYMCLDWYKDSLIHKRSVKANTDRVVKLINNKMSQYGSHAKEIGLDKLVETKVK